MRFGGGYDAKTKSFLNPHPLSKLSSRREGFDSGRCIVALYFLFLQNRILSGHPQYRLFALYSIPAVFGGCYIRKCFSVFGGRHLFVFRAVSKAKVYVSAV